VRKIDEQERRTEEEERFGFRLAVSSINQFLSANNLKYTSASVRKIEGRHFSHEKRSGAHVRYVHTRNVMCRKTHRDVRLYSMTAMTGQRVFPLQEDKQVTRSSGGRRGRTYSW
jgi:hypothetical protein